MKYIKCYPDFKMKAVTFSFDDGTYHDIEMIEVMNKFNLKGTFNLNSKLMYPSSKFVMDNWVNCYRLDKHQIKDIYKGHEIASHTSTHTGFNRFDDEALTQEINEDIVALSEITKEDIVGFAYPYGIYNDEIIARLKKCGIIYARATKCDYTFNIPTNLYTFGGSCTISCQQFPKMIQKWLKLSPKSMKLFYIWGHSYELDLYHVHEKIYYQYEKLANKEDTWYATNKDVFSYILAFKKLKFYQKSNEFVNKSDKDLFVIINNKKVIIKAFSVLKI